MKILIVDDCQTTRKLIGIYLKSGGFDVAFAENGLDAIEKLRDSDIKLILSDLNMPYMDGIEFLRAVRANPLTSHIPVIMVTTEADEEERKRAYEAGANGYMIKPVSADMVKDGIKNILRDIFSKGGDYHV